MPGQFGTPTLPSVLGQVFIIQYTNLLEDCQAVGVSENKAQIFQERV